MQAQPDYLCSHWYGARLKVARGNSCAGEVVPVFMRYVARKQTDETWCLNAEVRDDSSRRYMLPPPTAGVSFDDAQNCISKINRNSLLVPRTD